MKKIFRMAILLVSMLMAHQIIAGTFNNSGTFSSNDIWLSYDKIINNGSLIGKNSVTLYSNDLSGKGLIKGTTIAIETTVFNYTGTIECLGVCEITAKQAFDESMFTRAGNGEFKIKIVNSY